MNTPSFRIVTVCNRIPQEPYYCLNEFVKSLAGHIPYVLGTQQGEYTGLGSKPKLLHKAIKNGNIQEEYIIFCDCWDLVFSCNPQQLFDNYINGTEKEGHPVYISAEKNCYPSDLKKEYDELEHLDYEYKYLNSGMVIGKMRDIFLILEAMELNKVPEDYRKEDGNMVHVNDQFLYQQIFLKQPVKIKLDYSQAFCNTLHSVKLDELEFDELGILNKETGLYPFAFHMNGSAKTDGLREPILKHLNLL